MNPDEFDAWQQREQASKHRADVIRSAEIRAELYASCGLPPATGCAALSCEHCSAPVRPCRCSPDGCADSACHGRSTGGAA